MKKLLSALCLFVILTCQAQQTPDRLFEYPTPPDELEKLDERTSYLVEHFWDRCNLGSAILNRDAFKGAFLDYASFMPYATREASLGSIDNLIKKFQKDPKNLLTLCEIAEEAFYNGDADFTSDELYLPFAQAAAQNKKITSANRARFSHQARILGQSQVGMTIPEIEFTKPDGTKGRISEVTGSYVLVFFNDPDCDDCALARVRLSADNNINDLIDSGLVKIVSIYPGEPDEQWRQNAASYNPRWIVGAAPDVDENFDLRNPPVMYYLNKQHTILSKTLVVDNLLEAFKVVKDKISQ